MNEPKLSLFFDGNRRDYRPEDEIRGEYQFESLSLAEPEAIELAILWFTEGKGDEDLAVHFFERRESNAALFEGRRGPQRFSARLPASPLSYDGVIVKIRWCVRVRAFLSRGKELVAEEPFRLGRVPSGRRVSPGEPRETAPVKP